MKRLRNLLPVLLVAILAYQCTSEETENNQTENLEKEKELEIEEIAFESFRQEPFYSALSDHLDFEPIDGNTLKGKKKHKFNIHKKHVKKISKKSVDYTSFTFYMTDDDLEDPTILQNLMVVKRKNELEVYRFFYGGAEKGTLPHDYNMAQNTTFEKLLDFDMDEMGSLASKEPCLMDDPDCNGGGGNNGGVYCYNVEVYISYACSGNGATGTHYHDSDCNCTDGNGSCSSPYTDYQNEMFCTSDSSSNGAAQEYVSENNFGGGGTSYTSEGSDILISSVVENNMPEGADPLAYKIGLNTATPVYNWFIAANNEAFYELVGEFMEMNGSSVETRTLAQNVINSRYAHTCVSPFPFVKYPTGSNYHILYPKLTQYLKSQLPNVANIPKITNAIHQFTQLPINQIQNDLQWGKGPEVHIAQLDNYPDCNTCTEDTVGYFDKPENPNKIFLDIDYVAQLENGTLIENDNDAAIFFLGTTILHEYVHYGDYNNGFDYPGEEGRKFEIMVYGNNVQPDNARLILNKINN
ncbi:hypothetical protein [Flagellimonas zhangzhouensis]|uniref:Metallopeptidase toxin 3 n=1 Tax=Flagellimonas zhangzhouensis TaxID=1073328 RepID=A0A1H2V0W4_9FLAO|nr:hypothetical protein [Allomuricauda zhangzhouensis]SDQ11895.1 Metallopeptidase toxin 3 [Allomuricauda zhangzhouensis]SDW61958.1 Metallopeptidase toxin 3 [Allomuricauda zhangzhouensis]